MLHRTRLASVVRPESIRSQAVARRLGGVYEKTIPFRGGVADANACNLIRAIDPPAGDRETYHWVIVPFGAIVNAKPGSSPFPGVVAFWANRTSFTTTFRVTAPVGFSSHAF